jgi:2-dehydro-3-deoxyphosphogalactonate aldolase
VTGAETFPIAVPAPHPGGPYWMLLRVDTDEGVSGYREMMLLSIGFRWPVIVAMIEDLVDQALIGRDPYNAEELFDKIYGRAGYSHVPELTKLAILSAFDLACWDIVGKHLGQPVHRLLGGRVRDTVRTYTSTCTPEPASKISVGACASFGSIPSTPRDAPATTSTLASRRLSWTRSR